jgi:hypothetical protein
MLAAGVKEMGLTTVFKNLGEKPANGPNSKAFLLSIYLVSR